MKIDVEEIENGICEQLCKDNDGCKFEGTCVECLHYVEELLLRNKQGIK